MAVSWHSCGEDGKKETDYDHKRKYLGRRKEDRWLSSWTLRWRYIFINGMQREAALGETESHLAIRSVGLKPQWAVKGGDVDWAFGRLLVVLKMYVFSGSFAVNLGSCNRVLANGEVMMKAIASLNCSALNNS